MSIGELGDVIQALIREGFYELEDVIQTIKKHLPNARIFVDYDTHEDVVKVMVRCQDLPDITTMCYLLKAQIELENKYGLDFDRRYDFWMFY
jgi:hypothetical protein